MRICVTGGGGMLARALDGELRKHGHELLMLTRTQVDVTDAREVEQVLGKARPDAVIHCAAYTRVDDAEMDERSAWAVNAVGTLNIALACRQLGARLAYISTDYVFSGASERPYRPTDPVFPINAYGRSKLAGEVAAQAAGDALIVRTSWLYGAGGKNFVSTILRLAHESNPLRVVDDQRGSPTWTRDLAFALMAMLENSAPAGVYHVAGRGEVTWYGFACAILEMSGLSASLQPVSSDEFPRPAPRPGYSVLDCADAEVWTGLLPNWEISLRQALRNGGL